MKVLSLIALLVILVPVCLSANEKKQVQGETETLNDQINMDINNVFLLLENDGTFGKVGFAYYPYPNSNIQFLYDGGPVVSGIVSGNLRTAWNAESILANELQPGIWEQDPDDEKAKWYTVTSNDAPGSQAYIDWADAVDLGAEYFDLNQNGSYQPAIDRPAIIGDITAWTPYNDNTTIGQRNPHFQTLPIGLEIQQTSWALARQDVYGDILFFHYRLINRNSLPADSLIFSIWSDPDLGDAADDLVGSNPQKNIAYCYNDSDDNFYGPNPPAYGLQVVQGPVVQTGNPADTAFVYRSSVRGVDTLLSAKTLGMSSFMTYIRADPILPTPTTAQEARNYQIGGKLANGQAIDPSQFGTISGGTTPEPRFFYNGDPLAGTGWLDDTPVDRKMIVSCGPFSMASGDTQDVVFAMIVSQGNDALGSLGEVLQIADLVPDLLPSASVTAISEPLSIPQNIALLENYPNPFNPTTTFRMYLPTAGRVQLTVFDISGRQVAQIFDEFRPAGESSWTWEVESSGLSLASGTYFVRLQTDQQTIVHKILLLK